MSADYDPEMWGQYVDGIRHRPGWTVARLIRESGLGKTAIWDYINRKPLKQGVTVQTIVAITGAAGDDPIVGFRAAAGLTTADPEDAEIAMVLRADGLSEAARDGIIAGILARRERNRVIERQRGMDDTIQMITIAGGRVD